MSSGEMGSSYFGDPKCNATGVLMKRGKCGPDSQGEDGDADWSDVCSLGSPATTTSSGVGGGGGDQTDPPRGLRLEPVAETWLPHVQPPELREDALLFAAAKVVLLCHSSLKD